MSQICRESTMEIVRSERRELSSLNQEQAEPNGCDPETHSRALVLPTPDNLKNELFLSPRLARQIRAHREQINRIVTGEDKRLIVIVGPCSLHCDASALEFAKRLQILQASCIDSCLLVMRAYLEKPRTSIGWKGMLYDPKMTGASDMREGIVQSRQLLLQLAEVGLPLATEALSPLALNYIDDLISWVAVGARTTESQIHREMASALPCAVGFKNGTDGTFDSAINALKSASHPHDFLGANSDGQLSMICSTGNPHGQLVLRGGNGASNFDEFSVAKAVSALNNSGRQASIIVDCSHENSGKDHRNQNLALRAVKQQIDRGESALRGVMLESHLLAGKQSIGGELEYGISVTDACIGWEETEMLIRFIAE